MVDGIIPFRPRQERDESRSPGDRLAELERLEELLELMHEHNVQTRTELERRIDTLEAALEAESRGPKA